MPRLQPLASDPIPPTLRDGEPPRHHSDVIPKKLPTATPTPLGSIMERSPRIIETLAETAAEHVARGEREEALRTIADAVDLLEDVRDRSLATRSQLVIGESLVQLGLYERAEKRLEEAVALADRAGDAHLGARARLALGKAWLGLDDSSCRGILEDAGEMFEELGDVETVLMIDKLLRIATLSLEESPRSFHGHRRMG
jgi:tetratricopeptide (TPR) repeat protein